MPSWGKGQFINAISAAASLGIGQKCQTDKSIAETALNVGSHALVGGIGAKLSGGQFAHGFFSAGFNGIAKIGVNWIPGEGFSIFRVSVMAIVGGTISDATGGKFANGAVTGALQQTFNGELSKEAVKRRQQLAEVLEIINDVEELYELERIIKLADELMVDALNLKGMSPMAQDKFVIMEEIKSYRADAIIRKAEIYTKYGYKLTVEKPYEVIGGISTRGLSLLGEIGEEVKDIIDFNNAVNNEVRLNDGMIR